jgi:hypothetical protein
MAVDSTEFGFFEEKTKENRKNAAGKEACSIPPSI